MWFLFFNCYFLWEHLIYTYSKGNESKKYRKGEGALFLHKCQSFHYSPENTLLQFRFPPLIPRSAQI